MTTWSLFIVLAFVAVCFIVAMVGVQRCRDAWQAEHVSDCVAWAAASGALAAAVVVTVFLLLKVRVT